MTKVRIAFVDDHPTLLAGMAAIFATHEDYEIVGTAMSADEAVTLAETTTPDVMILDLSMPGDVNAAIGKIIKGAPAIRVIIFTAFANVDLALQALDVGAHGFVLKGRPSSELFSAIESVRRGELFVSPDFAPKLMGGFRNRSQRKREMASARLSPREVQIVDCLLEGKSNKEIANALELSEKTIKHYMTNLMTKLRVKSRLEVVLAAKSAPNLSEAAGEDQPPLN
ncbi:MAG TPA: response regulator transcription factor [Devosia sp.]